MPTPEIAIHLGIHYATVSRKLKWMVQQEYDVGLQDPWPALSRPLRPEFPGAVYHLTSRGNARQKIVLTNNDRHHFLNTLAGVIVRYGWICHAYCLMENHYHLLIEMPKGDLQPQAQARGAPVSGTIQSHTG